VAADEVPFITLSLTSPYALAVVQKLDHSALRLYAAPLASLNGAQTPWRLVADGADAVSDVAIAGSDIFLVAARGAERPRVVRTSLLKPDMASAPVVVPASEAVLQGIALASDALYVRTLDGGVGRMLRLSLKSGRVATLRLPFDAAIGEFGVDPLRAGVLMRLTGWTEPPGWFHYDPVTQQVSDTGLLPRAAGGWTDMASVEVQVPSADGTPIPLSIVYRRGLKRDGSNPTLLLGFGALGVNLEPDFNPTLRAWLERGGVYATAHVRGGGEYGEAWHLAGTKGRKARAVEDYLACADYLVANRYTSPPRLGGQGVGPGGILVAGALARRPELFAAVVLNAGITDTVRSELSAGGRSLVPELGSVASSDEFRGLLATSAYHQVHDGVAYPAVLLATAVQDPRTDVWQSAKMAARLQAASRSGKPVLLRVDYGLASSPDAAASQLAADMAHEWAFLLWQLGHADFQPR
jgi:prolyl oligopeptidase